MRLCSGVDVAALNFAEKAWMSWYLYWGNPLLATGIMAFLMHEVRSSARRSPAPHRRLTRRAFGRWSTLDGASHGCSSTSTGRAGRTSTSSRRCVVDASAFVGGGGFSLGRDRC